MDITTGFEPVIARSIRAEGTLRDEGVPGSPTALDAGRSREFESHHPDLTLRT